MQTVIKADDGDVIIVHADDISIEQLTIRLDLENPAYGLSEFDQLTLSTHCARELGAALIQAAELVERNSREFCGTQHFNFVSAAPKLANHHADQDDDRDAAQSLGRLNCQ
jgi:hypothetical protein